MYFLWVRWYRPGFDLFNLPSADRMCPRNVTLFWKKNDFFGLIFRWNDFNLSKTSAILSNIWSTVSLKIQISSR